MQRPICALDIQDAYNYAAAAADVEGEIPLQDIGTRTEARKLAIKTARRGGLTIRAARTLGECRAMLAEIKRKALEVGLDARSANRVITCPVCGRPTQVDHDDHKIIWHSDRDGNTCGATDTKVAPLDAKARDFRAQARAWFLGKAATAALVSAVKEHAIANYSKGGWDYVVECYEDAQLAGIVAEFKCKTPAEAEWCDEQHAALAEPALVPVPTPPKPPEYLAVPVEIELHLSGDAEFTAKGWGRRVKAAGGRFNACRGLGARRFVTLPLNDSTRELANQLHAVFGAAFDYGRKRHVTWIARRLPKDVPSWVDVQEVPFGAVDACAEFLTRYQAALRRFVERTAGTVTP